MVPAVIKNIIIVFLFILTTSVLAFSQGEPRILNTNPGPIREDKLNQLQRQARSYRSEGLKQQSLGNLDAAISLYQKAIQVDPSYMVAYNDLGILYEAYEYNDRAEESYLQALKFDPNFLSAYSNLAMLYEKKRDLEKAFFYWKKRAALGSPDDPWTQTAKKRMEDIIQVSPRLKQDFIEQETIVLMNETAEKQMIKKSQVQKESMKHLEAANKLYNRKEYKQAQDELELALSLNPKDKVAQALVDIVKVKIKMQEGQANKEANIKKLQEYFNKGMKYYQQDNLPAAKREFERIIGLTATPQKK